MLTAADLIHLPYTPDLSEGGIAYACRWLTCSYERISGSAIDHLRRMVGEVAVELAFRRHLSEQSIPFNVLGVTPFTHPDRYEIRLGGHRCNIKSFLITRRSQITRIRRDPGSLLQAPALVPVDEFAAGRHQSEDLYLFAFLLGLITTAHEDMQKAVFASQPVFLTHLLPATWARPESWMPIQNLSLKSECDRPVTVEIGGQNGERNLLSITLELLPRQRVLVEKGFHSLTYIHAHSQPEARIGIHSPRHGEPYLIPTRAWDNLWVYGMDIWLTGWLTHEGYRRKAKVMKRELSTFHDQDTGRKKLLVPARELNPLGRLLEKVRRWEAEKVPA